jgi:ATP-dependent Clp protease ATP-binding subunit ClpC
MTSNIGAKFIQKRATVGFQTSADATRERMEEQVMSSVKQTFAPEFINRLDEIIIFDELINEDLMKIIDLQVNNFNEILAKRTLQIKLTEKAKLWLIEKTCSDRNYGARPLRRALQRHIEDELSESLIQGEISEGSLIEVDCKKGNLVFKQIKFEEIEDVLLIDENAA